MSIRDIAWEVSEEEYRSNPAYSYSILAKYEREGFNKLDTLYETEETAALTFGSAVDCLITDKEHFYDRFYVMTAELPAQGLQNVVKAILEAHPYATTLGDIRDDEMANDIINVQWNNHWRNTTRVNYVREHCGEYFRALVESQNKIVISQDIMGKAMTCVEALQQCKDAEKLFDQNTYYQLKFRARLDNNIDYRCMFDGLYVDKKRRTIYPLDLKTTGSPEDEFYWSFLKWRYDIQGRLYWRILRRVMDDSDEFNDWHLMPMTFIVVNKDNPKPLAWRFAESSQRDSIAVKDRILRDPEVIANELNWYLTIHPEHKNGINYNGRGPNNILEWLSKELY